MPNSNSIYDVYFGAGEAMGEYEASLRSIEDVWSGIEYSEERTAQRQERAGGRFEDLLSVVELGGELYGGREARKEFEESIPGVQKFIAKESYEKSIKGKAEAIGWEDLGEESRAKLIEKYAPVQVGKGGKLWEEFTRGEKLWQRPMWRFGEGEESYTIGKEDVSVVGKAAKYGYKPEMDIFRTSLLEEATGVKAPVKTIPEEEEEIVTTTEPPTAKTPTKPPPVATMPPLDKETYQMLSDMVDKFKKGNQKPMLAEDLATLQPWIDQMARSRGWTGAAWQ